MREINEITAEVFRRSDERIKERKRNRNRIIMCCIPFLICITVFSVAILPAMMPVSNGGTSNGGTQMPDIIYDFTFNDTEYTMFRSIYEKKFPITNELTNSSFVDSYFVDETHIGDFMGIVPADKNFDEGKLYHYNAYPNSDEIVILYRDGLYRLFVAKKSR